MLRLRMLAHHLLYKTPSCLRKTNIYFLTHVPVICAATRLCSDHPLIQNFTIYEWLRLWTHAQHRLNKTPNCSHQGTIRLLSPVSGNREATRHYSDKPPIQNISN